MQSKVWCPSVKAAVFLAALLDASGHPSVWVYLDGVPHVLTNADHETIVPHIRSVSSTLNMGVV